MTPLTRPLVVLLVAALSLAAAMSPAHADDTDPDPVRGIVLPPLDAVVGLLPPIPVPPAPYTGEVCADGADACIDEVIVRMEERLDRLSASCAHGAVFSLAYLRVTENVRDAVRSGYFADRQWLNRVDAVFAELYFDVTSKWDAGDRTGIPAAWRIALQAEDDRAMSGLGNFLLAMNAHINRDFPYVLAEVGLAGPRGSHKADHDRYNQRLDSLYAPVFAEEARRFDPTFDDIDAGTLEETVAGVIMRGWREMVWRHAELLTLARTPHQQRLARKELETYAALQAMLIRSVFVARPAERDAWCAEHGRDG
ncbi:DUF5995 family protein [Nocardioides sp. SYSU DS0651]|uniref:DUF5995 family protein n=1 Tax=Nocardioides sp. SYSU DS0651 TaxID=3415955 RepID=UPI003F4CAC34